MSYARFNIWLRDLNCCPKNVWKVELVVKTCGGDYLVDFNPDVIDKLKEAYPDYDVRRSARGNETTIRIVQPKPYTPQRIKHIEVEVPPGCYIVRAWVCWGNLWTDRMMVIVRCGEEACVNLIVPRKNNCIRDVVVPFMVAAKEMRLDPQKVNIATELLITTGRIQKEALRREVTDLTEELEQSEATDAGKYVEALKSIGEVVRGIRVQQDDDPE